MAAAALAFEPLVDLTPEDYNLRIRAAKAALGTRLVVLGHHYQREEVYRHADLTGDSLKLSRDAAVTQAQFIVFCGVHFMAEVADILSRPEQSAFLPDLAAGCSMADMANLAKVERAWREIKAVLNPDEHVTPVTYINSTADLKAFCGRHGGVVCTSGNAQRVLEWAWQRREKVLFFPDQHLGRNTAHAMGVPRDEMAVWDFNQPRGGLTVEQIKRARLLLWKGHCSVHQLFQPGHIDAFRARQPQGMVISHPECSFEVCERSDFVGSTEHIIQTIAASPAGSHWLVGTELNLVQRLHERFKGEGKTVEFMSPTLCMCSTMYRVDAPHLLWILESLQAGHLVNAIRVPAATAQEARVALGRMLAL